MENQSVQNLVSEPALTPVQVPQPKTKFPVMYLVLSIFILLFLASTAFLYYQNQQLKSMLASYQSRATLTPSPAEASAQEGTANWKTYTNTKYNFSLKYPANWVYKEDGADSTDFAPSKDLFPLYPDAFPPIFVAIKSVDDWEMSALSLDKLEEKPITVGGINVNRITGLDRQSNERNTAVKFTHDGKIFIIVTFGNNYIQTFDQILSTFKFTQ